MTFWTITSAAGERTFEAANLADAIYALNEQRPDTLQLIADGRNFDADSMFAPREKIVLRSRTQATPTAPLTGGKIFFQGHFSVPSFVRDANGMEKQTYEVLGPWDYFDKHVYLQRWKDAHAPGGYVDSSHIRIPTKVVNNAEVQLNSGQMIGEVVDYIRSLYPGNEPMQKGTIEVALPLPIDEKIAGLHCSEVIRQMLQLTPDATCEFDHSTEPPTFNVWRDSLVPKNIALSEKKLTALTLRPRYDLQRSNVVLLFEVTEEIDGSSRIRTLTDGYPLGSTGREYNVLMQAVNLYGVQAMHEKAVIATELVNATVLATSAWWTRHGYAAFDQTVATPKTRNIVIRPVARTGTQPNVLLSTAGGIKPWMLADDDPDPVLETFYAYADYELRREDPVTHAVTWDEIKNGLIYVKLRTTVLDGADEFSRLVSSVSAEPVPVGMAQDIWRSLSQLYWEGDVTVTEAEASGGVTLKNVLNYPGGTGRYAAINAFVRGISVRLSDGTTTIQHGLPTELGLDARMAVLRLLRTRRTFTAPNVQATGDLGGDDELEGEQWGPIEDAGGLPASGDNLPVWLS